MNKMNSHIIQDERILQERRRIQSKAYSFMVIFLLLSIVIQQFFMNAPFSQYAAEFMVLAGCGFYTAVCHYKNGIDIWSPADGNQKKLLLTTLLTGILSMVLLAVLTGNYTAENLLSFLAVFIVVSYGLRLILSAAQRHKQRLTDEKLDQDE